MEQQIRIENYVDYEPVTLATASDGTMVECAKCEVSMFVVEEPMKKPVCPRCWEVIKGLMEAAERGFRFGV